MNPGDLRHLLLILSASSSVDSFGQDNATWTTLATVWGSIKPISGKLASLTQGGGGTEAATATHTIMIRWNGSITIDHRIQYGQASAGETPRIFTINDLRTIDERRAWMMLTVTELKQ